MSLSEKEIDSLLTGALGPTLVLDLDNDIILRANQEAIKLFHDKKILGTRFCRFIASGLENFLVFISEVEHRDVARSRLVNLQTVLGDPLNVELTGRLIDIENRNLFLLHLLDLDALEKRSEEFSTKRLFDTGLVEWQRAQRFFADLERENDLILNAAGEGIYGINADGRTTFVNRAAQQMLGWSSEDLLGYDIHTMIHHHHLNGEIYHSHQCPIYQSFRHEKVKRIDNEVFWRKDGKPIRVEYVSTPIYDGNKLAGAVVIFRDITERLENERKLHEALKEIATLRDKLEQENAYLQESINIARAHHDIIGRSFSIRGIIDQVRLVGPTETNVLVRGESGVGKSLIAQAIHEESTRKKRAMIHFKAGSINSENIEAELFGQVRGANADALKDRPGKLEIANGGTLFIDEISDLPLQVQGRLLDALQGRAVVRLGDDRRRPIDLRIIASTSCDIDREVNAGRLRQDLVLHLGVFPIICPPLRERKEDIPDLSIHLLHIVSKRLGRKPMIITEGAMQKLLDYNWPGNVRELANVIERGAIISKSDKLQIEIKSHEIGTVTSNSTLFTEAEIEELRRKNIITCMRETRGRVSGSGGAAELLGVRPTTLYSRLTKLGLNNENW